MLLISLFSITFLLNNTLFIWYGGVGGYAV